MNQLTNNAAKRSSERLKPNVLGSDRVWVEVSREALRANVQTIRERVAPLQLMAVLKADAYGLGVSNIAPVMLGAGVDSFGVAELEGARVLAPYGLPIHMLGGMLPGEVEEALHLGVIMPVGSVEFAEFVAEVASRLGVVAKIQLVVDTGMGRLGVWHEHATSLIEHVLTLPSLSLEGMYSHFSVAYTDEAYSLEQVSRFRKIVDWCQLKDITLKYLHLANSDGLQSVTSAFQEPFTMVRSGINLYGLYDEEGEKSFTLQEAVTFKSRLVAIRDLPAGVSIGYGRTFTTERPMRLGTVCAGYADGVPLAASNSGAMLLGGVRCPIVGRVSMDYTTIDLTGADNPSVGDEVVYAGGAMPVSEVAMLKGTHPYELLCSIGSRVRRYVV